MKKIRNKGLKKLLQSFYLCTPLKMALFSDKTYAESNKRGCNIHCISALQILLSESIFRLNKD